MTAKNSPIIEVIVTISDQLRLMLVGSTEKSKTKPVGRQTDVKSLASIMVNFDRTKVYSAALPGAEAKGRVLRVRTTFQFQSPWNLYQRIVSLRLKFSNRGLASFGVGKVSGIL